MRPWAEIAVVVVLVAAGAGLRAVFLAYPVLDSDQAVVGLMGLHILKGEFPIYFWGEPYSGTLESYLAAVIFFLFGVSRWSLELAPFSFSLVFLVLTWRLGRVVFGPAVGILSLTLVAIPPMLLTWHSVLARGNYIENLVLGNLILLLTLRLATSAMDPVAHRRIFGVYGFVAGFAWYMSFQSVHYLVASAVFLVWRGRRRLLFRQAGFGLLAAGLGSLPFWIFNVTSAFSSIKAIGGFAGRASVARAASIFLGTHLPIVAGASSFRYNFERVTTHQLPVLEWIILSLYAASFILGLVTLIRRSRPDAPRGSRGVGMILLVPLLVGALATLGGFVAGQDDPRYLLPLYTAMPLLLGALIGGVARWSWVMGAIALAVVLISNLYGHVTTARALPRQSEYVANDRALFETLRARGLPAVFVPEYWFSYRFTFDAGESLIFATPFWRDVPRTLSKYPAYTRVVSRAPSSAFVLWALGPEMEATLAAGGERFERLQVGRFTLLHSFESPAGLSERSLPARSWHIQGEAARRVADRDPITGWSGDADDTLRVDLGELASIVRISIHLGEISIRNPHGFEVLASATGSDWHLVMSVGPLIPGFAWMGNRFRLEEHGRVGLRFPPVAARYLAIRPVARLPQPWAIDELFVYAEGDEVPLPVTFQHALGAQDQERWTDMLIGALRLIEDEPDLEAGHLLFRIALLDLRRPRKWRAVYQHLASALAREGREQEAQDYRQRLTERRWGPGHGVRR
jgi:Dolichyl-phosphate-mannose-protein mannosyltransferase